LFVGETEAPRASRQAARVGEELEARGLARRWRLPRLGVEDLLAWLGEASTELVDALEIASDGLDTGAVETWREWRSRGAVVRDETGCWRLADGVTVDEIGLRPVVDRRLPQLLGRASVETVETARKVLSCAALEGLAFTADAVARALRLDPDVVIDLLDDCLTRDETRPEGLVVDLGLLAIPGDGDTPHLACYSFASDFIRRAFEASLTEQERIDQSRSLAESLLACYSGTRAKAKQIAALLERGGDLERASEFAAIASHDLNLQEAILSLRTLVACNPRDRSERRFLRERLVVEALTWQELVPDEDLLSAFERAVALSADPGGSDVTRCVALGGAALSSLALGRFEEARSLGVSAVTLAERLASKRLLSEALRTLARAEFELGHIDAAEGALRRSIAAIEHAVTLLDLSYYEIQLGRDAAARRSLERAVKIARERQQGPCLCLALFGLARLEVKDGDNAEAAERLTEALSLAIELRDRRSEARIRVALAGLRLSAGDALGAQYGFKLALQAAKEVNSAMITCAAATGLARSLYAASENEAGRAASRQAVAAFRRGFPAFEGHLDRISVLNDLVDLIQEATDAASRARQPADADTLRLLPEIQLMLDDEGARLAKLAAQPSSRPSS
jgi:tetratricopeptide (TPR) repeat protein